MAAERRTWNYTIQHDLLENTARIKTSSYFIRNRYLELLTLISCYPLLNANYYLIAPFFSRKNGRCSILQWPFQNLDAKPFKVACEQRKTVSNGPIWTNCPVKIFSRSKIRPKPWTCSLRLGKLASSSPGLPHRSSTAPGVIGWTLSALSYVASTHKANKGP